TAGRSFTHRTEIQQEKHHHKLVTEGVYTSQRHPRGFSHLVYGNAALHGLSEEHYLQQFLGRQYVE
ncbi:unnamed protein product, partial [Brassica oleracea var. botrytis]